jgi:hypothetical protein
MKLDRRRPIEWDYAAAKDAGVEKKKKYGTQTLEVGRRNAEVGKKRKMGHGFAQIYTDKNNFYALRAGLSVQQRVEVKNYHVPGHSAKSLNIRIDHGSSIINQPEGL